MSAPLPPRRLPGPVGADADGGRPAGPPRADRRDCRSTRSSRCARRRAAHGNGIMEVTARGSLQVRGLTPRSAPLFAVEVAAARHRRVGWRAGVDQSAAGRSRRGRRSGATCRRAAPRAAEARLALAPKVSVVIDGGGALHLDALTADIRLRAVDRPEAPRWLLALHACRALPPPEIGGRELHVWLGAVAPERAVDVVLAMLREIATLGPQARAADLLRSRGVHSLREDSAPFRHRLPSVGLPRKWSDGTRCATLAGARHRAAVRTCRGRRSSPSLAAAPPLEGARAIRPAPDRVLMLIGVPAGRAVELAARQPNSASSSMPTIRAAGSRPARVRRPARPASFRRAQLAAAARPAARGAARRHRHPCLRLCQGLRASRAGRADRGRRRAGLRHRARRNRTGGTGAPCRIGRACPRGHRAKSRAFATCEAVNG